MAVCDMGREVTPQEMKDMQLAMTESVARFCEEKGLRYSLGGGTLLGAIRHKGYIPWDDDVDVMLPRPDYEVWRRTYKAEKCGYAMQHADNDLKFPFLFTKIYDPRTVLEEKHCVSGVYIDVFPVDGLPVPEKQMQYAAEQYKLKQLLWRCNLFFQENSKDASWIECLLYRYRHWFARKKIREFYNRYPYEKSEHAGGVVGSYPDKENVPRRVFDSYSTCEFEGRVFNRIADYDTYLKIIYGDYMQLPPEEKRVSHHLYKVYWKE